MFHFTPGLPGETRLLQVLSGASDLRGSARKEFSLGGDLGINATTLVVSFLLPPAYRIV
jgi:hypothetical protein